MMKYFVLLQLLIIHVSYGNVLLSREIDDLVDLLEIHIVQLQELHDQSKFINNAIFNDSPIQLRNVMNSLPFNHSLIKWCIKTMDKRKNLAPLFDAWETFKSYRYVEGLQAPIFIKECALLIFVIYNNILIKISSQHQRVSGEEISALFNKVASLPIRDLIVVLDKIRSELTEILAQYPLKPHQTMYQWLKENWWVPPTVFAGIIVAIIFKQ